MAIRLERLFDQELEQKFREGFEQGFQQSFQQSFQQGFEQGFQRGFQRGEQQRQRLWVESLLKFRFGELDKELAILTEQISVLPPEELISIILQLSREELVGRFPEQI